MPRADADTICAVATPPGRGGIGIVRVSGPRARELGRAVTGRALTPRRARHCDFLAEGGEAIDAGIALFFEGPRSYTGEDTLELQGHGGAQVTGALLDRVRALGARPARPGEFSERAFLNGRLDLAQAEAVADLIDAGSREAARCAMRTLKGEFSRQVRGLARRLTAMRVGLEASIDFGEEDIDPAGPEETLAALAAAEELLGGIVRRARQGAVLKEGLDVVIAGRPNAGKSSLLNALAGADAAIVADVPGTTRDLLREELALDGLPVHVTDTAGLRPSGDAVEAEGVRRAGKAAGEADRVLLVIDAADPPPDGDLLAPLAEALGEEGTSAERTTLVFNKIDRLPDARAGAERVVCRGRTFDAVRISALRGDGLESLREHLKACAGWRGEGSGAFMAHGRQLAALAAAGEAMTRARSELAGEARAELAAEDLRVAQRELGAITGEVTSDDLLGEIFSSFCIGK